ncbi:hypothetical protein PHMEG_00011726, partial [Phytophthora megakarya]
FLGMLGLVESKLPFGSEQWASIASSYNAQLPSGWPERDGDSLKRKFMSLKNKRKPTGDPDCPSEVKRAKVAFRRIEARCAVSSLNDDDSEEGEKSQEEEESEEDQGSGESDIASFGLEAFTDGPMDTFAILQNGDTTPQRGSANQNAESKYQSWTITVSVGATLEEHLTRDRRRNTYNNFAEPNSSKTSVKRLAMLRHDASVRIEKLRVSLVSGNFNWNWHVIKVHVMLKTNNL